MNYAKLLLLGALAVFGLTYSRANNAALVSDVGSGEILPDGTPRGIRNNNPLNIVHDARNDWVGAAGRDGRFVIFSDPVYGIRAAARILMSYERQGITTIDRIINRWAPPIENKTEVYIQSVESISGMDRDSEPNTVNERVALLEAMIYMENGEQPYSRDQIVEGVMMA